MEIAPNYRGGGIVNLVASIQKARGGKPRMPTINWFDKKIAKSKNIVLMIIDGLGFEYMKKYGRGSFLEQKLAGKLTSVFPSTTAACITSIETGVPPSQHGITSWFMWVKEFGMVIKPLPFEPRLGGTSLDQSAGITREEWFPMNFKGGRMRSYTVTRREFINSAYTRGTSRGSRKIGYSSLRGMLNNIERIIHGRERKFVYSYWPEFDHLCHQHGTKSGKVRKHYSELDRGIEKLAQRLEGTNTSLIVTADHGLIDVPEENNIRLDNHPELYDCLTLPLVGEGRAAFCYLRPDKVGKFKYLVRKKLSEKFELHRSWDLVRKGYFGPGPFHPRLYERVGDFILLAKRNYCLQDLLYNGKREILKGMHGGLSSKEMLVPVCMIRG